MKKVKKFRLTKQQMNQLQGVIRGWMMACCLFTVLLPSVAQRYSNWALVDTVQYRITYRVSFIKDTTLNPVKRIDDTMLLDIGNRVVKFHQYTRWHSDSIHRTPGGMTKVPGTGFAAIQWEFLKNYPEEGRTILHDIFGPLKCEVKLKTDVPQWKIISDSVRSILEYPCHLAETYYKGRLWKVWYAEDIPVGEGPWMLCGLPGLILRAEDSQSHYRFEAEGLQAMKQPIGIYSEMLFFKGQSRERCSYQEYAELRRRYHFNRQSFVLSLHPEAVFVRNDGDMSRIRKPEPYNPIERE